MRTILLFLSISLVVACQKNKTDDKSKDQTEEVEISQKNYNGFLPATGSYYIKSNISADESAKRLLNIVNNNKSLGLVEHFEHHEMASSKGLALDQTHAIFFGNPKLGTPLIQKDQLIALDLPQKIVTFDLERNSYVYRLSTSYLSKRYEVSFDNLSSMTKALDKLSQKIANNENRQMENPDIKVHQGIIIQKSNKSFNQAIKAIRTKIKELGSVKIMAELDHQKNANSVDMQLRPTHVIMFGNPEVGIPLIQKNRSLAVELPMKFLIYKDENGDVQIAFNDMEFLLERYKTDLGENYGAKINQILSKIASSAI